MKIPLIAFSGEAPRWPDERLPDGRAAYALDCDFSSGDLRGLPERSVAMTGPTSPIKSVYQHDGNWYAWTSDTPAVRGPVVDDPYNRFYFVQSGQLRVARGDVGGGLASPSSSYLVGVPKPMAAPSATDGALRKPGGVDYAISAFCRDAEGTLTEAEYTLTEDGLSWIVTLGSECASSGSGGGSSDGFYPVGSATYQNFNVDIPPESHILYSTSPSATSTASRLWFYNAITKKGYGNQVVMTAIGVEGGNGTTRTFYYIEASEAYCTDSSYTPPTQGGSISTECAATPSGTVIRLTLTYEDGSTENFDLDLTNDSAALPDSVGGGVWKAVLTQDDTLVFNLTLTASGATETRAYCFTCVNKYGEEGAPSDPLLVDATPGTDVTLSLQVPASGAYCPITRIRLYRTATGTAGTNYLFVKEVTASDSPPVIPGQSLSVTDDVAGAALGEMLSTLGYEPPPDNLYALAMMSNGILVATRNNEVWFSEPYLPYAWNPGHALSLPNTARGLATYEQSVFVTTTGRPWLISGPTPDAMSQMQVPGEQAGLNRNSLAVMGSVVAYLSHDGIVMARGLDVSPSTSLSLFTREVWRERYKAHLASARLSVHDGNLVVTFDDGAEGFILQLDEGGGALTRYSEPAYAACVNVETDWLYFAQNATLYAFKGSTSRKPFVWTSKAFVLPRHHNFGALQVNGSGTVTVTMYGDGVSRHHVTIALGKYGSSTVRLPAGFLCRTWQVRFDGAAGAVVESACLATTKGELANV